MSPEEELRELLLGPERLEIGRLRAGLDALSSRFETPERMATEVSSVLNEALRATPVPERSRLTDTLAVLITQPVRQEIKNAQPEIMEALYPVADDLVAKGVKNAVDKMNQSMQQQMRERLTLIETLSVRLEALISRRSVTEVWLTRNPPKPEIDLMLVDRQSGLPIAAAGKDDESSYIERSGIASMLSILESFAADSLNAGEPVALQRFETDSALFLTEGSPTLALVARVKGSFPGDRDALFARQFKQLQRDWHSRLAASDQLEEGDQARLIQQLDNIRTLLVDGPVVVDPVEVAKRARRRRAVLSVTAMAALCLVLFIVTDVVQQGRLAATVGNAQLPTAYPLKSTFSVARGQVTVRGLVRYPADRERLRALIAERFPRAHLNIDIAAVGEI